MIGGRRIISNENSRFRRIWANRIGVVLLVVAFVIAILSGVAVLAGLVSDHVAGVAFVVVLGLLFITLKWGRSAD